MTTIAGARLKTKSLKLRPTREPIRMFGGSPINVAVPPISDATHLSDEERVGPHPEMVADDERHRHDQQHGGDVIEKGGIHLRMSFNLNVFVGSPQRYV